jgi:hypothetical protein
MASSDIARRKFKQQACGFCLKTRDALKCSFMVILLLLSLLLYIYVYMFDIETNINPFVGEAGGTKFALDEDSFPRGLNFRRCCKMDRWILQGNMRLTWAIFSTHILLNIVGLTNRIGSSIH